MVSWESGSKLICITEKKKDNISDCNPGSRLPVIDSLLTFNKLQKIYNI